MFKKSYLLFLLLPVFVLTACTRQEQAADMSTNTGEAVVPVEPVIQTGRSLVNGNTSDLAEMGQTIQNIEDIVRKDLSYNIGNKPNTELNFNYNSKDYNIKLSSSDSGNVLTINDQNTISIPNPIANLEILGGEFVVQGIYGPYIDFTNKGLNIIYSYKNSYSDYIEKTFARLNLDANTMDNDTQNMEILYQTTDQNGGILTTDKVQNSEHLYQNLYLISVNGKQTILSGDFDGFSYDGYNIFAYTNNPNLENGEVYIYNLGNNTTQDIKNIKIGQESKFWLKDDILTTSYGYIDFNQDSIRNRISQYSMSGENIWTIELSK